MQDPEDPRSTPSSAQPSADAINSKSDAEPGFYFTDVFGVDPKILDAYGAFNVSLVNDLPLFIDSFLLFNSDNPEYRQLHDDIIHLRSCEINLSRGWSMTAC